MNITNQNLYYQSGKSKGYLNFPILMQIDSPIIMITGARGIGKTYGALYHFYTQLIPNGDKFLFLRRSDRQLDVVTSEAGNIWKPINEKTGEHITSFNIRGSRGLRGFYQSELDEKGRRVPVGDTLGYALSLSTSGNFSGISMPEVTTIFYDEFIPKINDRALIKNEGDALLDLYETVNRNREINGDKPVKLIMCSNATTIQSDILLKLGLTQRYERMMMRRQMFSYGKYVSIICPQNSPISEQKKKTGIYEMINGSEFYDYAINNDFAYNDSFMVENQQLNQFKPVFSVGRIEVHANRDQFQDVLYYVTDDIKSAAKIYRDDESGLMTMKKEQRGALAAYIKNRVAFSSMANKYLFKQYYNIG